MQEEKFNQKDALNNQIEIGEIYGYANDNNGICHSVIGVVTGFTPAGMVSIRVMKTIRGVFMHEPKEVPFYKKNVAVKAMKLFRIHLDYLN